MAALIQHNVFVHFHLPSVSSQHSTIVAATTAAAYTTAIFTTDKGTQYIECFATGYTAYICNNFVLAYVAAAILTPILTVIPTVTPSPTVTHSPVMMGGVNVAAAVAIPVMFLLLLLLVIGVVGVGYYKCYQINKGLPSMPRCTYAKGSRLMCVYVSVTPTFKLITLRFLSYM